MRVRTRRTRSVALASAVALALTACASAGGGDDDGADGADGAATADDGDGDGGEPVAAPGLEGCVDDPNNCNSGEAAEGGEIVWLVDQTPDAWFSYSTQGGSVYTLQALHGLLPPTGQWEPDGVTYEFNMDLLAEEPELLNDGTDGEPFQYQFVINEDAVWNDGTPIDYTDFQVSWWMATSPEEGYCEGCDPRSTIGYDDIESIEAGDSDKVAVVTLKEGESDPEWFGLFSVHGIGGGLVPAHIAEQEGFDITDPAGLGEYFEWLHTTMPEWSGGPYIIESGDLDTAITKVPNPDYYGEMPTLETMTVRYVTDQDAFASAIQNNEVQGGSPASFASDVITSLEQVQGVELALQPGPSWSHMDVNLGNDQLADVALRQAIFTAIDVDEIGERQYGDSYPEYTRRRHHLFGEESDYFEDLLEPLNQGTGDVDAAIQILEDAGYEGIGEQLTLDGEEIGPFRIRGGDTESSNIAMQLIQTYLADLGIELQIQTTDELGVTLAEADYDLMIFGWSGSPFFVSSPGQFWETGSGSNFGGYSNEDVDALIAEVGAQAELDDAADFANQAARIVAEEAYVLPLTEQPVYLFVQEGYVNVRDNGSSSLRGLYNNEAWGVSAGE